MNRYAFVANCDPNRVDVLGLVARVFAPPVGAAYSQVAAKAASFNALIDGRRSTLKSKIESAKSAMRCPKMFFKWQWYPWENADKATVKEALLLARRIRSAARAALGLPG